MIMRVKNTYKAWKSIQIFENKLKDTTISHGVITLKRRSGDGHDSDKLPQ